MSKRSVQKHLQRLAELDHEVRGIFELADKEERGLTEQEQKRMSRLAAEIDACQYEINQASRSAQPGAMVDNGDFASRALADVVAGRSILDYGDAAQSDRVTIYGERAITSTNVAEVTPTTISDVKIPLQAAFILDKLGVKLITGVKGNFVYPTANAIEASIEGENVEVGDTTIDFGSIKPSPKRVSIAVPWSNLALKQANQDMMSFTIEQSMKATARTLNTWLLSKERGVFKDVTSTYSLTANEKYTWAQCVGLQAAVKGRDADVDNTCAYIATPSVVAELKTTPKEAGSAVYILENGKIDGIPVIETTRAEAGSLGFGVWGNVSFQGFGDLTLIVDRTSKARKDITDIVNNSHWDMLNMCPESFAIARRSATQSLSADE